MTVKLVQHWMFWVGFDQVVKLLRVRRRDCDPVHRITQRSELRERVHLQVEVRYEWFEHFEGMVISSAEGMVKPEPEIFELMCARHGFAPADALFIDDSAANIDAAAALGFDTVLFTDADALRSELEARALLG